MAETVAHRDQRPISGLVWKTLPVGLLLALFLVLVRSALGKTSSFALDAAEWRERGLEPSLLLLAIGCVVIVFMQGLIHRTRSVTSLAGAAAYGLLLGVIGFSTALGLGAKYGDLSYGLIRGLVIAAGCIGSSALLFLVSRSDRA